MKENNLFSQILTTVTKYLKFLVVIVLVGICVSGIRVVKSGEVAVILRFGQLVGDTPEEQVHEAGLLFAFPYIIDEVITVPVSSVMEQSVTTYYTPADTQTKDGGYVLTGDQNVAYLSASVKYVVSDPVNYALHVNNISATINGVVSNAMLTQAASVDVDDLLTSGKDAFAAKAMAQADQSLKHTGVTLTALELTQVSMPNEVKAVYDRVNSATVSAATTIENAYNYRNTLIPYAESSASSAISLASGEQALAISNANKKLAEFWGLLEEYQVNPETVRTRVYSQKVSHVLGIIQRIRVVEDGETTVILYP